MSPHESVDAVRRYHDATKHHVGRYARSLGYLDWATQPDPFRRFDGADLVDLVEPLARARAACTPGDGSWLSVSYDDVIEGTCRPAAKGALDTVSVLLRHSLGLSAWKQAGPSSWALRVNPSSGNLHPTEGYVVLPPGVAGPAGVFHYRPDVHALERRCVVAAEDWAARLPDWPAHGFVVGLTSIAWREAWKYGERAFRYCQHDAGHAMAAIRIAAAMLGWRADVVPDWPTADMAAMLGVDRDADFGEAEREEPECLLLITPGGEADVPQALAGLCATRGTWKGSANVLSTSRVVWDAIDDVAAATRTADVPADARAAGGGVSRAAAPRSSLPPPRAVRAAGLVLQRRSAVAMSGRGALPAAAFFALLGRLLPGGRPPFDALWWTPRVHLVCFVHRVTDVEPGLYVLARTPEAVPMLQQACREDFAWVRVGTDLPFYLLVPMDARQAAGQLSCGQAIAADGFFSVGMLAEFDGGLEAHGAAFYRDLFRETGVIGQMLYLEAEAAGARGTGIGCFFDDSVHAVLGIRDHRLQSLYHFTVGEAVEDTRLQTRPGYAWG